MPRDFALLFPPVGISPYEVVTEVLPLLGPIGAAYRATATRMDLQEHFWRLSTTSEKAKSLEEIASLFESWDGIALELESKFGPTKLMAWKQPSGGSGVGLFETSAVFTAQAEDPDVCDIFDSVALEMCRVTDSVAFALVGDPGINSMKRDNIAACISKAPQPISDPLVYAAGVKIEPASRGDLGAAPEWRRLRKNDFLVFRSPRFGSVPAAE